MYLKEMRNKQGMSLETAAAKIGVKASTLARWEERKAIPGNKYIINILETYECNIDNLRFT